MNPRAVKLTTQISNERKTAMLAVVGLRTDGEKPTQTPDPYR